MQYDDFLNIMEPHIREFLISQYHEGGYGFFGSEAPHPGVRGRWKNFSVGVFRWELKSNGKGLKKGKTIVRVNGVADDPDLVYKVAMELCTRLEDGDKFDFKSISFGMWP